MRILQTTLLPAVLLLLLSASTAYGACGDNTCDADETCVSCPADCPDCCGDGECNYLTESCRDCDMDCGTCQGLAGKSCKATNMCGQSAQDCYCDYLCFQKGDCCLDICLHCPNICVAYSFTCGDGVCGVDETCESCPGDCPCPTCGDGKCEYSAGEDCSGCSADCGDCCGNGVCEPEYGEICGMCKNDCACPSCGNGVCEPTLGEDNLSCPPDCPVVCGDKKCNLLYESCSTCPGDCDPCPGTVKVNIITNLPSCEGLCGKNNAECWCDANCHLYGDCCPDICDHCKMMPNCNSQCGDGICSADEDCTSCDPANPECKWCPVCGDGVCHPAESCQDCSGDCGSCCGNGACEAELGENNTTCSVDCPVINGCGDGVCTPPETCSGCPQDCFCCGNGNCESPLGEGCKTCPQDCGQCAICGNGTCEDPLGENCYNCPKDCKSCTCVLEPDTVDVPSIDGVNLLGGQAVFEHTVVFPPEACDQGSGVTMGSFLQQFFENVPKLPFGAFLKRTMTYVPTANKVWDNPKKKCVGTNTSQASWTAGVCFAQYKISADWGDAAAVKCEHESACTTASAPTYICLPQEYCCTTTKGFVGKSGLELKFGPKLGKKGKGWEFLGGKIVIKPMTFAGTGEIFVKDQSVTFKGPTCPCNGAFGQIDRYFLELQMGLKASMSAEFNFGPKWLGPWIGEQKEVSGEASVTGCVGGGVQSGTCTDTEPTVGMSLEIKLTFNVLGLLKPPPINKKLGYKENYTAVCQ